MYPDNAPLIILNEVLKQSSWMNCCAGESSTTYNSPCAETVAYFAERPAWLDLKKKKSMSWKTSHIEMFMSDSIFVLIFFLKTYLCHVICMHLKVNFSTHVIFWEDLGILKCVDLQNLFELTIVYFTYLSLYY